MEQDSINRLLHPQRGTLSEFEEQLQNKIKEINMRSATGRIESTTITIPIIVHVIHNGEAVGSGSNISQAQIQSQIAVLNEDYRKKLGSNGYNTNPVGADIGIEFCLSPVDEKGNALAEPGIHRYKGSQSTYARDYIDGTLKPLTIWNPNLFFNVWTLKFGGTDSNLLGYAQFPDQSGLSGLDDKGGVASTDGVVILYSSFGSAQKGSFPVMQAPYNLGRTLSHETGHWLGLRHIWGDGICADDFVSDTPTQKQASSGCPNTTLSCDNSTLAMVQNYMDYSNDACMNIFTNGQKARMLAVLELSPRRKSVYQANLCSPSVADKPIPNFTQDRSLVLLGGEVNYTDLSTNFPTSWVWTFEGGDPGTSSLRNPKVKYSVPGTYKVTLISANSIGTDTLTVDSAITVSKEGICTTTSNFKSTYTPSLLKASTVGGTKGYLTGHSSLKYTAFTESFVNALGYSYISGVKINFGLLKTAYEDSTITVTVWNARGPQGAPGSVIETKQVLLQQIQDDIQNNRLTTIYFDRVTPVFSRPYHVGVQINYDRRDSLAIISSANGENPYITAWYRTNAGLWNNYSKTLGANIALDIEPIIGVNPSTQIAASDLSVFPGAQVTLNGSGASIFVWSSDDGLVKNYTGPQLIVHPLKTTTYTLTGSGLALCDSTISTTVYIPDNVTGVEKDLKNSITLYPNPGNELLSIVIDNNYYGPLNIELFNSMSQTMKHVTQKDISSHLIEIDTHDLQSGIYFVKVQSNGVNVLKKWIKLR
jgi:PKD repeat protein